MEKTVIFKLQKLVRGRLACAKCLHDAVFKGFLSNRCASVRFWR
jgi:hypothetical protein